MFGKNHETFQHHTQQSENIEQNLQKLYVTVRNIAVIVKRRHELV